MVKYNVESCFPIVRSYFFNLVLSTWGYKKLLPNLKVVTNLGCNKIYKFDVNNFFFSDFNNIDL